MCTRLQSGGNGSRAVCAPGYTGIMCSVCADNYFQQFGKCAQCPATETASVGELVGISFIIVLLFSALFYIRKIVPVDVLKLGLSMLQVRS